MKSLHEYIVESIDEALQLKSDLNGREIYLRGWERYELAIFKRMMKQQRRNFEKQLPLLAVRDDTL